MLNKTLIPKLAGDLSAVYNLSLTTQCDISCSILFHFVNVKPKIAELITHHYIKVKLI